MSFTVSASMTNLAFQMGIKVLVLTGATEAGGASGNQTASPPNVSVTPNGSNSYVAFCTYNETNSTAYTASSNNTLDGDRGSSGSTETAEGHYSGTVTQFGDHCRLLGTDRQ